MAAVKWWPLNRGLLSTALNGEAVVGTKVSGRQGDQFSLKGTPLQIFRKRRNRLAWTLPPYIPEY